MSKIRLVKVDEWGLSALVLGHWRFNFIMNCRFQCLLHCCLFLPGVHMIRELALCYCMRNYLVAKNFQALYL